MLTNAKNGTLQVSGSTMYYIRFGKGRKNLVMLPGLGDGLATVKGKALPMAMMYHEFAKDYTVYMFSRRNDIPRSSSTRDMARDLKQALDVLGIEKCDLFGISMGGMISQHFAADYPDIVDRLVLCVTCAAPNNVLVETVNEWIALAQKDDHAALMESTLRRMYSDNYYRKNKWLMPVIGKLTKPKSYDRFLILAEACLNHNAVDRLSCITAKTLVIGGEQDHALSPDASREIAAAINGAKLKMYPEFGHGLYEEAKGFKRLVLDFLNGG